MALEHHPLEQIVNVQWVVGLAVIFAPQVEDSPPFKPPHPELKD